MAEMQSLGDRSSLSRPKNHSKPSQEFSEQFGPSIHKMKGFSTNSPPKAHPNFAQNLETGKKKAYTALLQRRTFLCRKKWGPQRKDFGGKYGFPGFYRVFVSTTGLESFSFRPQKFPKRFSIGGGRVRFLLL